MKKFKALAMSIGLIAVPNLLVAGPFDGSTPLLCAVIDAIECGADGNCVMGSAESENLPQFVEISFKDKVVKATKGSDIKRVSKIKQVDHNAGSLIMQGSEDGRGWNIVINEKTGKLSATVAGDRVGFIVFGACTAI